MGLSFSTKALKIYLLVALVSGFVDQCLAEQDNSTELRIGVLAKRGEQIAVTRWSSMAVYLSQQIPAHHFVIVPLKFDEVRTAVERKTVDFLLTNSGMFVDLSFDFKLFALATLKRNIFERPFTHFGSVVFTRKDRKRISQLSDLVNQDVAAVNKNSLGGWIAAFRELDTIDISEESFHSLNFLGTHDQVVYSIQNKTFDIGIVRTDTLERMQAEGKIDTANFHVLPPLNKFDNKGSAIKEFPLLLSTRLYPEWPLASLQHISENIAEKVSAALIMMQPDSDAARNAKILGWTIPKNYREVDSAFAQLKIGYYEKLADYSLADIATRYWKYILIALLLIVLLVINTLYIISVNKKLKETQDELRFKATHDRLTGLPNRILFYEIANRFLHIALREQTKNIVLVLNLDQFKNINDTYGHDIGDLLLQEVSQRMSNVLRNSDIIARVGSDEFLAMLSHIESVKSFKTIMQRLIEVVTQPFETDNGLTITVGCSIGVAHYPKHGSLLKDLISKAGDALHQAKHGSRGQFVIFGEN